MQGLEQKLWSTLDGLSAHIALLDDRGEILIVNKAWRDFAAENGGRERGVSVGANYLAVCDRAQGADEEQARAFAGGIRDVLAGRRSSFELQYPCHSPDEERWFLGRVTPYVREDSRRVVTAHENMTERRRAEENVRAALREKEVLLKEVHHRVKNNLQLVSSLLKLHARDTDEATLSTFAGIRDRVRSMAIIHDSLYRTDDFARVDFASYARSLANRLYRAYSVRPDRIAFEHKVEDVEVSIDFAVPCGLIMNELLSNSFAHAFPGGRKGNVRFELYTQSPAENSAESDRIVLAVRDDGVGLPLGFDIRTIESVGLGLVRTLSKQIDAEIEVDREAGTSFEIIFTRSAR